MTNSRIKDKPSYRELLNEIHNMERFKQALPLLKPFLKLIGVRVDEMEAALAQLGPLASMARDLVTVPDRFNDLFAPRGWIMYEAMNLDVAKAAIAKAEAGDIGGAELDLVTYYNEETIGWNITWMQAIDVFCPRVDLVRKALTDYAEGRYHACVPVILAQLDGLVNDLGARGFFAAGIDLVAWDSIAAHSSGLNQLAKILGKRRCKTTTEQIRLPYRQGILHGHDLGYDNKLVAAKAWAALFAVRDWAMKVERGEATEPVPAPKSTWRDLYHKLRHNAENDKRLEAWSPRDITLGTDIPVSAAPEDYETGTPEYKLAEFLAAWRTRNYGLMAQSLGHRHKERVNKAAGELRAYYEGRNLKSFAMIDLRDQAPAVTTIMAKLIWDEDGDEREHVVSFRLLHQDAVGDPAVHGKPGGHWALIHPYV